MGRKWIPTLLFIGVLIVAGAGLYHAGGLPLVGGRHDPALRALQAPLGGRGAAHPWQTLPRLLGDLWLIAGIITAVRVGQGLGRLRASLLTRP
ncbi:MAG: hypothetical protein K6T57_14245 [Thermaceae bacterium]|nr:hypothetical protein [Thermaceae bacterium]